MGRRRGRRSVVPRIAWPRWPTGTPRRPAIHAGPSVPMGRRLKQYGNQPPPGSMLARDQSQPYQQQQQQMSQQSVQQMKMRDMMEKLQGGGQGDQGAGAKPSPEGGMPGRDAMAPRGGSRFSPQPQPGSPQMWPGPSNMMPGFQLQ